MPYSFPRAIPAVAKNWTEAEQKTCIAAANSVLERGGSEGEAIFACIHAAGRSKQKDEKLDQLIATKYSMIAAAKAQRASRGRSRKLPKPPVRSNIKPIQLKYVKMLRPMARFLNELTKKWLVAYLENLTKAVASIRPDRSDAWSDDLDELLGGLRVEFYRAYTPEKIVSIAGEAAANVDAYNDKFYDKLAAKLIGVGGARSEIWHDAEVKAFIKQNVNLIESVPSRHLQKVETVVTTGLQQGWLPADIATELEKIGVQTENSFALIARDQTSKFNASLDMLRQKEIGVTKYIWRTAGDERVRQTHADNDGETFEWSDDTPGAADGRPGEEINCRCYAEPVLS